ncbi:MAG: tRNA epoxyqueuosine(34) reductase QueG [Ignavibacteriaceae bacterium]|nr:tRNA epoxyqueuosine(34) reductase QueG [Ignavibacteriaceae bacterium]
MQKLLENIVFNCAEKAGFDLVGIAQFTILEEENINLQKWIENGYSAGMGYMSRNLDVKKDVRLLLPSVKSVISLGYNYFSNPNYSESSNSGKISRYATGEDYHHLLKEKVNIILSEIYQVFPGFEYYLNIDSGPVMDKAWAVKAGLGWLGKNSNIINPKKGSWFFIATILTNLELKQSQPIRDLCGSCTKCIDACPTGAIVSGYVVDSKRCISYQTIENKGEIEALNNDHFKNWIFGCDICQEVCPWNIKFQKETNEDRFLFIETVTGQKISNNEINLDEVLKMTQEQFSYRFRKSPVKRTKLKGLQRNAKFLTEKRIDNN